ncbi:MAG TPA: DUF6273 domain-containing protein [Clostridiales bacterium]|nr:DUF6273 domain-containing protein [Clostridiales bacterium]
MKKLVGILLSFIFIFSLSACKGNPVAGDVGTIVKFGAYEQDNDLNNGKEEIEWIILAKEGDKSLIISKQIIDAKAYNNEREAVIWETSSLRAWLNSTFLYDAFSASEQDKIILTSVKNEVDTEDKIFLLSSDEAEEYFSSAKLRQTSSTAYAQAKGVKVYDGFSGWWLRTRGDGRDQARYVFTDGKVHDRGDYVNASYIGVRPALWVNL